MRHECVLLKNLISEEKHFREKFNRIIIIIIIIQVLLMTTSHILHSYKYNMLTWIRGFILLYMLYENLWSLQSHMHVTDRESYCKRIVAISHSPRIKRIVEFWPGKSSPRRIILNS